MALQKTVPAHVPPELVVDLDMYNLPGGSEDPHLAWQQFRGRGPVVFSPYSGGYWVPVDGNDILAMWRDAARYSSYSVSIPDAGTERLLPIEADGPNHAAYRNNVLHFFLPPAVNKMTPEVRKLAVSLIEGFRERGECEFISEFAEQLPLIVFLVLMGLPLEDRVPLHDLVETYARDPDAGAKLDAIGKLRAYLDGWITRRTAVPGDDAISHVIRSEINGRRYTRGEVNSTCSLLLLGGLDTVASSLGFWALHLSKSPQDRAYIRDTKGSLLPVVNELMRRFPVPSLGRVVTGDIDHRGVNLKKGDRVLLSPSLHNLDGALYPKPLQVDFTRVPRHIGFGAGPHMCAGANLARSEFTIFLEEWLRRIPDFAVKPGTKPIMKAAPTNTVEELWLQWTP